MQSGKSRVFTVVVAKWHGSCDGSSGPESHLKGVSNQEAANKRRCCDHQFGKHKSMDLGLPEKVIV